MKTMVILNLKIKNLFIGQKIILLNVNISDKTPSLISEVVRKTGFFCSVQTENTKWEGE